MPFLIPKVRRRSLDLERGMLAVRVVQTRVSCGTALDDSFHVLQAWKQSSSMIVLWAVLGIFREAPKHRFMKDGILGNISCATLVQRESHILPASIFKLPSRDEGKPFCEK